MCDFTQCDPGLDRVTVADVVRDRLGGLGVPVVAGAPVGHGLVNEPVVVGAPTVVEARSDRATVTFFP